MAVDIFRDELQHVQLFGKPVLTTNWLIPRETVPDGWFCYDMRGTKSDPGAHATLVDYTSYDHSGTVLSPVPLKRSATKARRIGRGDYSLHGETMDLEAFCAEYGLDVPDNPIKFEMRPASPDEAGLFYAQMSEEDDKGGPIETQRSGFDGERRKERSRAEFSPSGGNEAGGVSSDEGQVMDQLRRGVLKDFSTMLRLCHLNGGEISGGIAARNYGFVVETERYRYCLRCNPVRGDYQAYLTCFDLRQQELNQVQEQPHGPEMGGSL